MNIKRNLLEEILKNKEYELSNLSYPIMDENWIDNKRKIDDYFKEKEKLTKEIIIVRQIINDYSY